MSLLIIGATGTLGRQIVLQALKNGYQVRCLVRNVRKSDFLRQWGVELVYGDLRKPETLPPCLKGITAIIDASSSRPDELDGIEKIDWYGKLFLIEAAKAANIKRFIFFSVQKVEQLQNIPLMKYKYHIELKLKNSGIPYTIFRLTGFYQAVLEQYALPILEGRALWLIGDEGKGPVAFMDTQTIAQFCLRSLQLPKTKNQLFLLSASQAWSSTDIVSLCEEFSGKQARIETISSFVLKSMSQFFDFFKWGEDTSERLAFCEVSISLAGDFSKPLSIAYKLNLYNLFKFTPLEIIELDEYFLEYYIILLKCLQGINFEDVQKQKNLIL